MDRSDHEVAILAARAGAAVIRGRFGSSFTRIQKSATDFATDVDLEAEGVIVGVLRAARPADTITGEESGVSGTLDPRRQWLVDPLCGTLNFAAQTPMFAVNVALLSGADALAAACADPLANEIFWTDGGTAYLRVRDGDERLLPSAQSHLIDVNLDGPYPNAPSFSAGRLLSSSRFSDRFLPRVCSTTLALTWVAAGRRAGYVTDGDLLGSVHFAAGIALCRAARCVMTNLQGGPVHSGIGGLIAAADEQTHAALVEVIAAQFASG